jgi:RHS repeat-associated protein
MRDEDDKKKGGAAPKGPPAPGTVAAPAAPSNSRAKAVETPSVAAPALALPKGGGAVRALGEKLSANPATGAASLAIPIYTSPGRDGAQPALTLNYASSGGNGPFGLGFGLSIPAIARRTEKRLPEYQADDVFVLSGAEDLVPSSFHGIWNNGTRIDGNFVVTCYQPRVDTLFARIERWTDSTTGDCYWRSITRDNLVNVYGQSPEARLVDPDDPTRVFRWLLESTSDAKGNRVVYRYRREDGVGVAPAIYEQRRRATNVYPDRILYGNRSGLDGDPRPDHPEDWLFEAVFDYGERAAEDTPSYAPPAPWLSRRDPFSTCKPGFEVRTQRLCRQVLMFHRLDDANTPVLVRSTDFSYAEAADLTYLSGVTQTGYDPAQVPALQRLPPVTLSYTRATPDSSARAIDLGSLRNLPYGLDDNRYRWIDLDDEGVAGVLTEQATGWFYKRNQGSAALGGAELVMSRPSIANLGVQRLLDLEQDGRKYLVAWGGSAPGAQARLADGTWGPFLPFTSQPTQDVNDPNARLVDLDGDGRPDLLVSEDQVLRWYPSLGVEGFGPSRSRPKPRDEDDGPALVFADAEQAIYLADMSGDGLPDLLRIRNGDVCYWPNLGYGHFGPKVTMAGAPLFDAVDRFDQRRIRLADVDGTGTTDLIYLDGTGARYWRNCAGNGFATGQSLDGFPGFDTVTDVEALDLLGNGTGCLVWSSRQPGVARRPMRYLALTGGIKPHLLSEVDNGRGLKSRVTWAASTEYYLADRRAGTPWATRIPFPVQVVSRLDVVDEVTGDQLTTRYAYHHGFYDGVEHEFRGFGMVEQWDAEEIDPNIADGASNEVAADVLVAPPIHTKTWFHTGAFLEADTLEAAFAREYYHLDGVFALSLPNAALDNLTGARDARQAVRALAGKVLRRELYSDDGPESGVPFVVTASNYGVRALQASTDSQPGIFLIQPRETLTCQLERDPSDPRLTHEVVIASDDFGNVTEAVALAYPRRAAKSEGVAGQAQLLSTYTRNDVLNFPANNDWYRAGVVVETRTWEVGGWDHAAVPPPPLSIDAPALPFAVVAEVSTATEITFEATLDPTLFQRRLIADTQVFYRDDDGQTELPFGGVASRALPSRTRRLAFTQALLDAVFDVDHPLPATLLTDNGYELEAGQYWARSSAAQYGAGIFYQGNAFTDPFGNPTAVGYDGNALFATSVTDALANTTSVTFDTRVLQPSLLVDPNGNRSLAAFDPLGRLIATALQGKEGLTGQPPAEGDTLDSPTTAFEYHLEVIPTFLVRKVREEHQYPDHVGATPAWRYAFVYYDGLGREVMSKVEDDDGQPATQMSTRWVGTGRTVFNNKGKPVKQYEPYFSATNAFESEQSVVESGFTNVTRYDPLDRVIRLNRPNGTFALVEFDAWTQRSYDENDTLGGHGPNAWYARFGITPPTTPQQQAAVDAFEHRDTPAIGRVDVLGRLVERRITNVEYPAGVRTPIEYPRFETLDILGNAVVTSVGNQQTDGTPVTLVVQTRILDMLGRALFVSSADAGPAWTIADVADQPLLAYDGRASTVPATPATSGNRVTWSYDPLRRILQRRVRPPGGAEALNEVYVYGESLVGLTDENGAPATPRSLNTLARRHEQRDGAGVLVNLHYDFKGNLLFQSRQLRTDYTTALVDWSGPNALDPTVFLTARVYDAMNRETMLEHPDGDPSAHVVGTVARQGFGKHLLLRTVDVTPSGGAPQSVVSEIDYNEKGQRLLIRYGSGVTTRYAYEPDTLRLSTLTTADGAGQPLQGLTFTYDAVGNVAEIDDSATPTVNYNGGAVSSSQRLVYDALYRLAQATGREHIGQTSTQDQIYGYRLPAPTDLNAFRNYTESYAFDWLGNFRSVQHLASVGGGFIENWTRHYETDAATSNRLLSTSQSSAELGPHYLLQYLYDAAGNIIRLPHLGGAPGSANCFWNDKNQLGSVILDAAADPADATDRAYYVYDAAGTRVRKVVVSVGSVKRERIYLGAWERFRHTSGAVVTERRTVHVMDDQRRIALLETKGGAAPVLRYQLGNHLGSSIFELDATGQVLSREEYHPFGTTSFCVGPGALLDLDIKRYRYGGKERDDETGLYYCGARYFAPWLARWTSPDPGGLGDGPNLYAYAHGNPIRFHDPTGRQTKDPYQEAHVFDPIPIPDFLQGDATLAAQSPLYRAEIASIQASYRYEIFKIRVEHAQKLEKLYAEADRVSKEIDEKIQKYIDEHKPPGGTKQWLADQDNADRIKADEAHRDYMQPKPDAVVPGADLQSGVSVSNLFAGHAYRSTDFVQLTFLPRNLGIRPGGRTYRSRAGDDATDFAFLKEPSYNLTLSQHYGDPGDATSGTPPPKGGVTHIVHSFQVDVANVSKGRGEAALTLQLGYDVTGKSGQIVTQLGVKYTLIDPTKPEDGLGDIWKHIPLLGKWTLRAYASVGTEVDVDDKGASWKGISASFGGLLEFGH